MSSKISNSKALSGAPEGAVSEANKGQLQEIANYLKNGFWLDVGEGSRRFDVQSGGTLSYHFAASLSLQEEKMIRKALDAWTDVTGIRFVETASGGADLLFKNNDDGAYSYSTFTGGYLGGEQEIDQSIINVQKNWDNDPISINSYWFQTYMHEIGHALGLGHAGEYNYEGEEITYENGADFKMDSWQASVMSYFSQDKNPYTGADYAYLATLMPADILAIQDLYGTNVKNNEGKTVYGHNSNVDGYLGQLFAMGFDGTQRQKVVYLGYDFAFTVFDSEGVDTVNFANQRMAQLIDLQQGHASNVAGIRGAMLIALGTVIENAVGGKGNDKIIGNAAKNMLMGGAGGDALIGNGGDDRFLGGAGLDHIFGGSGLDTVVLGDKVIRLDLGQSGNQNLVKGQDDIHKVENVTVTSNANARLLGSDGANIFVTRGGRDQVWGRDGADVIDSGGAGDRIFGQAGQDLLRGRDGADKLFGGLDGDRLLGGNQGDILNGEGGGDRLFGETGNDRLYGGKGHDTLIGGGGKDLMEGHSGNDQIQGGAGADQLLAGTGADRLEGQDGNDALQGDLGNDTLLGGGGNDTLRGQEGNDELTGGMGEDVFSFAAGLDVVTDFALGEDTLQLFAADLWDGVKKTKQQVLDEFAFEEGGNVVFRFATGVELTLQGIASKAELKNDLLIA